MPSHNLNGKYSSTLQTYYLLDILSGQATGLPLEHEADELGEIYGAALVLVGVVNHFLQLFLVGALTLETGILERALFLWWFYHLPSDLRTAPSSLVFMVPSPSLSNIWNVSLNSSICREETSQVISSVYSHTCGVWMD